MPTAEETRAVGLISTSIKIIPRISHLVKGVSGGSGTLDCLVARAPKGLIGLPSTTKSPLSPLLRYQIPATLSSTQYSCVCNYYKRLAGRGPLSGSPCAAYLFIITHKR